MAGVRPAPHESDNGFPHWGSKAALPSGRLLALKSPEHETRWKQSFMDRFGADPDEVNTLTSEQQPFVSELFSRFMARDALAGPQMVR